ncbi:hypothetical protein GEMRC1_000710 [Eukaryota sp. GEM-RC1]
MCACSPSLTNVSGPHNESLLFGPALPNSVSPKTSPLPEEVQSTHPTVTTIEDSSPVVTSPSSERLSAMFNKDTAPKASNNPVHSLNIEKITTSSVSPMLQPKRFTFALERG